MLNQVKLYAIIGLVGTTLALGGFSYSLSKKNKALTNQVNTLIISREHAEKNLSIVNNQLVLERKARIAAEVARTELKEVPNEMYEEKLSTPVTDVLNNFNEWVRNLPKK